MRFVREGRCLILCGVPKAEIVYTSENHDLSCKVSLADDSIDGTVNAISKFGLDRAGLTDAERNLDTNAEAIHDFISAVWPYANYQQPRNAGGLDVYCWFKGLTSCEIPEVVRQGFGRFAVRLVLGGRDPGEVHLCKQIGLTRKGKGGSSGCERDYRRARQNKEGWGLIDNKCRNGGGGPGEA